MTTPTDEEIGTILRRRRESLNLTQEDIPDLSSSVVRKAENGRGLPMSGLKRSAYARGLGWPQNALDLLAAGADPATLREQAPHPQERDDGQPAGLSRRWDQLNGDEQEAINAMIDRLANK